MVTGARTSARCPGRIVRALKDAGTKNPVMMLDEIDKVGADWRGDPSSALLEVLDPAQNHTFRDHYLDVDLDLSEVLFIATANVAETIPAPLLDRMEVIRIDGYTEDEKVAIARHHLLPRQVERNGLRADEVAVTDDALRVVVADYTREAGVRNLERELGKLLRKVATTIASGDGAVPITVDATDVRALPRPASVLLRGGRADRGARRRHGPRRHRDRRRCPVHRGEPRGGRGERRVHAHRPARRRDEGVGADRAVVRAGARGRARDRPERAHGRFHLHVPAGAVPKDGPSAGITMTTALVSLLTDVPVRASVGMTGEVTLQGRVLPIGGLKQKVLAAHRAGLTEVIVPKRNEGDLEDVPEQVREQITFHPVEDVRDVLAVALRADEPAAATTAA